MTQKEQDKLYSLLAKDILQRLPEYGILIEELGGDLRGIEWVSISVTLQKGRKLDDESFVHAAEALAAVLPARILRQAAEISKRMKETGSVPVAESSENWFDAMEEQPIPSGLPTPERTATIGKARWLE